MKLKKLVFIIIIAVISFFIYVKSSNAKTATVTVDGLNLREEASTDADVIKSLEEGSKVEILEETDEWIKVQADDDEGYVKADYLKIEQDDTKPEATSNNVETENKQTTPNENVAVENTVKTETTTASETKTQEVKNFKVKQAKVKEDSKIYILPLINANKISEVKKDSEITIMDETNKWVYIQTDKVNGWILKSAIEETTVTEQETKTEIKEEIKQNKQEEVKEPENKVEETNTQNVEKIEAQKENEVSNDTKIDERIMYINSESVNVREGPGTNYESIDSFVFNNSVTVIGENGEWYKVRLEDGNTGYIAKILLSDEREPTTSREAEERKISQVEETSNVSRGQELVEFAKGYLGCPYVYGGSGPDTFDCSGFTMYVYDNFGISLTHSAIAQSQVGTYVAKEDLQPGDLVFFLEYETMDEIGHVGIYIGDGNFIHASSGTGYCVKISTLLSGSYDIRYDTARRVF